METTVDRFNADLVTECARLAQAEAALRKELQESNKQIKELESKLATARNDAQIERLKVELITKQLFGSRTERRTVDESKFLNQLRFSFLVESHEPAPEEKEVPETTADRPKQKTKKRTKKPNPKRDVRFP